MGGNCQATSVVYQAKVTPTNGQRVESYIGLTGGMFKTRYTGHKQSFNHSEKRNATELSKFIWQLKDNNVDYTISWNIIEKARAFDNSSDRCELCVLEKFFIIYKSELGTLNKRNELVSTCRHKAKFLLRNSVT